MLTQKDDLLFQSYFTFILLVELKSNNFLTSDTFDQMTFGSPWIKDELKKIGIDNQGCALIALYVMLAIPRELIAKRYPDEYERIRIFLEEQKRKVSTTYKTDRQRIDYLRHFRNAVIHARVSVKPHDAVIFEDCSKDGRFSVEIPLQEIGQLLQLLQSVHLRYIEDLQRAQQMAAL